MAQHNPAPIPRSDELLSLNNTIQQAPAIMKAVHMRNMVIPTTPVRIQIKTYSESGGVFVILLYLLFAGTFE